MLKKMLDSDLVYYPNKNPIDWKQAIQWSCKKLVEHNLATEEYSSSIIDSVEKYGPYIVIMDNVAMPHAQENIKGAVGTAIALTKFRNPVIFPGKEEKKAQLFFTIVSNNPATHLNNIKGLMEIMMNSDLIEAIQRTESIAQFRKLI